MTRTTRCLKLARIEGSGAGGSDHLCLNSNPSTLACVIGRLKLIKSGGIDLTTSGGNRSLTYDF